LGLVFEIEGDRVQVKMKHQKENGWIKTLKIDPPNLKNNTADADRLIDALTNRLKIGRIDLIIDLELLRQIPFLLRKWQYHVKCILFRDRSHWTLIGLQAANDSRLPTGLAVDLGTSRVVLRLVDLINGEIIAEDAFDNPQIDIGPDILARIHYAADPKGLENLHQLICDGINRNVVRMCHSLSKAPTDIYIITVAGNTAMTHLLLGLSPSWMIREPYIPVINRPGMIRSAELGLQASAHARVFVFPNIGSYFGGDLISGLLFSGIHKADETALLVDVGTNAEVVLGNKHWLIACAGAAGPALESGVTQIGMMAGPGVIDRIKFDRSTGEFTLHTIGEQPAHGICGSGLIDLAAELFLYGMIDIRGRFNRQVCGERLVEIDGNLHLIIVPAVSSADGKPLTISQIDLESLIRSKAAMYTILETIAISVGLRLEDVTQFYVAGTFGTFIQPLSAISIGMLPDLPLHTFKVLGNSSLGGATLLLTSDHLIDEIDQIRNRITYLELNVNQDFMNRFSAAKFLPHTDRSRFPTVQPVSTA
jgi:uncharacterized 2Fe-2S/4Fe-4S cluster protein (DUF4445 family)